MLARSHTARESVTGPRCRPGCAALERAPGPVSSMGACPGALAGMEVAASSEAGEEALGREVPGALGHKVKARALGKG